MTATLTMTATLLVFLRVSRPFLVPDADQIVNGLFVFSIFHHLEFLDAHI